jgi:acyl carrier protein
MKNVNELSLDLKLMLIKECNVKNCTAAEIGDDDQLIGGSGQLQLDSLDAVEIVSALERTYGLRLDGPGEARKVLRSIKTLREYVIENAKS